MFTLLKNAGPTEIFEPLTGLTIERNCAIPLRDRTEILCDLYRPEGAERDVPLLLAWGPYGKHALSNQVFWPRSGVDPAWLSDLTPFEALETRRALRERGPFGLIFTFHALEHTYHPDAVFAHRAVTNVLRTVTR